MIAPANVIDLLSILPFWIEKLAPSAGADKGGVLVILRILRLTRVFRVFKVGKYNDVFNLFARVVRLSMPALYLMLFFVLLGLCLFGTLIWFAEQGSWYPAGHPELIAMGITDSGTYLRYTGSLGLRKIEQTPFRSIIHSF